jgi:hypothetical protein
LARQARRQGHARPLGRARGRCGTIGACTGRERRAVAFAGSDIGGSTITAGRSGGDAAAVANDLSVAGPAVAFRAESVGIAVTPSA